MQETKKMNSQTIGALIGVVIVVIAIIVVGIIVTKNSITATEFNKIENGMTYEEVVEIIVTNDITNIMYNAIIYTTFFYVCKNRTNKSKSFLHFF